MSSQPKPITNRYIPTKADHDLRFLFEQVYALHDAHEETKAQLAKAQGHLNQIRQQNSGTFPRGSGPIDSVLLGVPVKPIDSTALADGVVLTFEKANGVFTFK